MHRLYPVLIVLLGAALLLPGIDRPFGATEANAGWYFGAIVRNLEHHGFWELRGTPLLYTLLEDPKTFGFPYLSHPPGLSWLFWLFGSAEWQMRLCTLLATLVAALGLYDLARLRFGAGCAAFAGGLFVVVPAVAVFAQLSYEAVCLAFGLALLAAVARMRRDGVRAGLVAAATLCAFGGTWIDWGFASFCLAAVPVAWAGRRVGTTVARLAAPAAGAALAVATILWWKASLAAVPSLPDTASSLSLADTFRATIGERPPFGMFVDAWGNSLVHGFTWPVLVAAIPGVVGVWRRDRGLALGLAVAGAFVPALFGNHVVRGHHLFFAYFAPLLALSAAVAAAWVARWQEHIALRVVLVAALGIPPLWESLTLRRLGATTFYHDAGAVLSAARLEHTAEGTKHFDVVHNTIAYGAYLDSEHCLFPAFIDPAWVTEGMQTIDPDLGVRYLWLDAVADPPWPGQGRADLIEYLAQFPRVRVPELETGYCFDPPTRSRVTIREAWLYTVRDARPVPPGERR